ncbi:MAG: hypothetical protein AAFY08_07175 [Planctomycetota bacterium]
MLADWNSENWFTSATQREAVCDLVESRLADVADQEECRYLMRLWWHLRGHGCNYVQYRELEANLSPEKMKLVDELLAAIEEGEPSVDDWIQRVSILEPVDERCASLSPDQD